MYKTIFFLSVLGFVIYTSGESSTCLTVYKEGGAPAVFQSPECPGWSLRPKHDDYRRRSTAGRCQSATRQGRRKYLEDRTFCNVDLRIPFPGTNGIRDTSVSIVSVFDGHNGAEASEMASNLLMEYFTLHTSFLLDTTFSFLFNISKGMLPDKGGDDYASQMPGWDEKLGDYVMHLGRIKFTLSKIFSGDFHLEILKESLLKAIDDIDAAFSKEASRHNFNSGSTAAVILIADGQILAANVGDSKAFLCSKIFQSPPEAKATLLRLYEKRRREGASIRMKDYRNYKLTGLPHLAAKELTMDHHPDRADERSRVEAAGGYVLEWAGVPRVNGHLAVSRSIGDLPFKSFGVISVPEVTDWQPLTANDSYLVAVSDGVLEKLVPQDVCDLFWELHTPAPLELPYSPSCSYSLADCIVDTALERGSMDNVAAVVVPFGLNLPTEGSRVQNYVDGQFGTNGIRDTSVAIVAVFDGHNGAEASELASNLLLEYFTIHISFILDTTFASQMLGWDEKLGDYVLQNGRIKFTVSKIFSGDFHLEILKESLLKAIKDIDATFCKEASRYNFNSGSTALVILIADGQILAANVGDSKAFLCSKIFQSPPEAKATLLRLYEKRRREGASIRMKDYRNFKLAGLPHFAAKELTMDHHPDRVDERSRIEAAGGYVFKWAGVSRVNGHLAVSRSIGDLPFKSFGVISVPEVTNWQPLTANDSYLVAVSDGVLEKLGPQDVCDLFWELHTPSPLKLHYSPSCSYSLADCIVDTALERGSMDNVAAVVVPFGLEYLATERSREVGLQNYVDGQSRSENGKSVIDKFRRLLVEKGNKAYLSGIREKYFGELFLGGTSSVKHPYPYPHPHLYYLLRMKESVTPENIPSRQPHVAYEEGSKHIARYVESFESKSDEIWLVFRHEGISLSKLLYTADDTGSSDGTTTENDDHVKFASIRHPSNWWRWLKTTKAGQAEMKSLIWQLLMALKSCHDRNITHRDIKPENMIVCFEDQDSGRCLKGSPTGNETYITKMRIIDFGSAMNEFTIKHLYGAAGPSRYDMWSAGVVILELIIGSPNVFQIDARSRTHALLDPHLQGWNEELKELAYKLRSFMELCILLPGSSTKLYTRGQRSGPPALWKCSEEFFSIQIKSRDPLKIGFPNVWTYANYYFGIQRID